MPGFFFAVALMVPVATFADGGEALADRSLAAACAACHGTDGRPPAGSPVPAIAGMEADRLRDAMLAFRSGARGGTVMPQIAKGYDDDRIRRLSRYFASQR